MDIKSYGAASRAAIRELGGIFTPLESVVPVDVAVIKLVTANPNRIGLSIVNAGTTIITFRKNPAVVAGQGLILPTNGSVYSFNWHDDADVVAGEFYAIGNIAGGFAFIFEEVQTGLGKAE